MKRWFISLVISLLTTVCLVAQSPIIPAPLVYSPENGATFIGKRIAVNDAELPDPVKSFLTEKLTNVFGIQVVFSPDAKLLRFKKMVNVPENSYSIHARNGVTINYSSDASCFYAITSFLQMLQEDNGSFFVQNCFIQDQPKFAWRGLHLDVSRHFFSVEEVKRYIDLMALYKFNTFHWHLTDDQGWRIEIKQFPELTRIGAWRDSTLIGHYSDEPVNYDHQHYGGFYTQEQIREVVAYAANRYITVIPEIEMPGHARAALAAYPEYSCTGKQLGVPGTWGVFEDIFCAKAESIDFVKAVLSEVVELFPAPYIHIGGDEAPKTRWKSCPRCQEVIRENGLKDEQELQSYFIRQIDAFLTEKGKKLIGWDEILEGGLSQNATVMSWRGFEGGMEAIKAQHDVVMSPTSYCYFDHYQGKSAHEPLAIGGFLPLEKVYRFNPLPEGITSAQQHYVLGGQANVWTEYIPDFKQVEYMVFPRALAMSQVLWCLQKPDFEDFQQTLTHFQLNFMKRFGIHYATSFYEPEMHVIQSKNGIDVLFDGKNPNEKLDVVEYQFEGEGRTTAILQLGTQDTLHVKPVNYQQEIIQYHVTSPVSGQETLFQLTLHAAIGKEVELITLPNEKYAGKGGFTLTDGIFGSRPWKGDEWLGFDTSEIQLIIDLEENEMIKSVVVNFLDAPTSWINLPESVDVYISRNRKKWKKISVVSGIGVKNPFPYRISVGKKGRYVKLCVHADKIPDGQPGAGHQSWTFMDEVMILLDN